MVNTEALEIMSLVCLLYLSLYLRLPTTFKANILPFLYLPHLLYNPFSAILQHGVNLIDTAEQYPIPSDGKRAQEGDSERVIGKWMKDRKVPRDQVVIATKINGGRNITPKNIQADCKCKCP
jgi:diketogulonate reductase-like aldo/keto reductase